MKNYFFHLSEQDTREFFRWLKEKKIYSMWLENRQKYGFSQWMVAPSKKKLVLTAFQWRDTPQGYSFWYYVNYLWELRCGVRWGKKDLCQLETIRQVDPLVGQIFPAQECI